MNTQVLNSNVKSRFRTEYVRANSEIDILKANLRLKGKVIIDVGCGTGGIAGVLSSMGAFVVGIDSPELIDIARKTNISENVVFRAGAGQAIPVQSGFADIILFYASFHHVPEYAMHTALDECKRVLKEDGIVCFCEPLSDSGSYYDLAGLIEDEKDLREIAYSYISFAGETNFRALKERYYYLERSFEDFRNLVNIFVPQTARRQEILREASELVLSRYPNLDQARFRSLARLNIIQKIN
jgi:ubiquinone/menaquinone biosynthesis C-methylase UbiE